MAWTASILLGLLEAVWAVALDRSAGSSRRAPIVVFADGTG